MDREQLRNRALSRIQKIRLDEGSEVFIQPLGALAKSKIFDKYKFLINPQRDEPTLEEITKANCFVVSCGLVLDESGKLLYPEEDLEAISRDLWDSIEMLSSKIFEISRKAKEEAEKNLHPTTNEDSSYVSQQSSDGGM